jgi:hypothetical protein
MKIFGIFFGANAAKLNEENLLDKVDEVIADNRNRYLTPPRGSSFPK